MTEAELGQRLERVERMNRRLMRGGLAALVLLVALGGIYAERPVPTVIKSHDFDVVDAAGKVRIRMNVGANGEPNIILANAESKPRIVMEVRANGEPGIILADAESKAGIKIGIDERNRFIQLEDTNGKPSAAILVEPREGPSIVIGASHGIPHAMISVGPKGGPEIGLLDAQGTRAMMLIDPQGKARISLFNAHHNLVWSAP